VFPYHSNVQKGVSTRWDNDPLGAHQNQPGSTNQITVKTLKKESFMPYLSILFLVLLSFFGNIFAADSDPEPAKKELVWLSESRGHIAKEAYAQAIAALQAANETNSADWNNLMGYSLRKNKPSDFSGAAKHYERALEIDPRHRGALEYLGELKLMTGDLAGAEALLATLDRVCLFGCDEYSDLKKAIQKFKSGK
jgi:tetratricopeptide (TPR) repeat protein